ncbi:MAG: flavodoxin domain-containing protein [Thermanaerothrix sp.]|nr:flavodoxin domain-containing protein [Thermanaerothrix sp.]
MSPHVLVVYATKYGATREIAERVAETLAASGLDVTQQAADRAEAPTAYDGVVLGSAVYAGRWLAPAADYLKAHAAALAQRPTWFFSSGPTGTGDPVTLMQGWRFPQDLQTLADQIHPRDVAFFHGALWPEKLNFAERLILKALKAPLGDFRDWDAIVAWAQGIAAAFVPA